MTDFINGSQDTAAYADVYMIEPTDPLYIEVGAKYVEVQASHHLVPN